MSRSAEMLDRRDALVAALEGLQRGQHKISISAVARKAGVTPALIHNTSRMWRSESVPYQVEMQALYAAKKTQS